MLLYRILVFRLRLSLSLSLCNLNNLIVRGISLFPSSITVVHFRLHTHSLSLSYSCSISTENNRSHFVRTFHGTQSRCVFLPFVYIILPQFFNKFSLLISIFGIIFAWQIRREKNNTTITTRTHKHNHFLSCIFVLCRWFLYGVFSLSLFLSIYLLVSPLRGLLFVLVRDSALNIFSNIGFFLFIYFFFFLFFVFFFHSFVSFLSIFVSICFVFTKSIIHKLLLSTLRYFNLICQSLFLYIFAHLSVSTWHIATELFEWIYCDYQT